MEYFWSECSFYGNSILFPQLLKSCYESARLLVQYTFLYTSNLCPAEYHYFYYPKCLSAGPSQRPQAARVHVDVCRAKVRYCIGRPRASYRQKTCPIKGPRSSCPEFRKNSRIIRHLWRSRRAAVRLHRLHFNYDRLSAWPATENNVHILRRRRTFQIKFFATDARLNPYIVNDTNIIVYKIGVAEAEGALGTVCRIFRLRKLIFP